VSVGRSQRPRHHTESSPRARPAVRLGRSRKQCAGSRGQRRLAATWHLLGHVASCPLTNAKKHRR
jgi:hypothetical protein